MSVLPWTPTSQYLLPMRWATCGQSLRTWYARWPPVTQSWWNYWRPYLTLNSYYLRCSGSIYFFFQQHLHTNDSGVILYEDRVVIPPSLCGEVLKPLHTSHKSVTSMMASRYTSVFWPGIMPQINSFRKHCEDYNRAAPSQPNVPPAPPMTRSILSSAFALISFTTRGHTTWSLWPVLKLANYHKSQWNNWPSWRTTQVVFNIMAFPRKSLVMVDKNSQ